MTVPIRPAFWVAWDCCPSGDCPACQSDTFKPAYRQPADRLAAAKQAARRLSVETPGSIGFVMSSHPDTGQPDTCVAEYMHGEYR
jgi:hypothetical protein